MDIFTRLMVEEEGQGLIEYALIIAIISLVIVAAGPAIATEVKAIFTTISDKLKEGAASNTPT